MKLPRSIRHWAARFLTGWMPEYGGMMHDYANGKWILIHQWDTDAGQQLGLNMVENMFDSGRDAIHIVCIRVGPRRGYFVVYDSTMTRWVRAFWQGIYSPDEAFDDIRAYCRQRADAMGFRAPDLEEAA